MIVGILVLVALLALVAVVVRKLVARDGAGASEGHAVRRFFQYALLYGLLVVVAIGLSGLLGRGLERSTLVTADDADLARGTAFTVVGVPLYLVLALWSRRSLAQQPGEARSLGWAFYVTAASLTSLVVAMFALFDVLAWVTGLQTYSGPALARLLVWGTVWGVHWWVDTRLTPAGRSRLHHLVGSLIGLGTAVAGLSALLGGALEVVLGPGREAVLAGSDHRMLAGAVTVAVAAPVWFVYWLRTTARSRRDPWWLGYVLLAGVAGGLVMAIASASTVLFDVLVWWVGNPRSDAASSHFRNAPTAAAAAVVGTVVWWYHHAVLQDEPERARTEVRRIYEYLMTGVGLLAAAGGLTTLLVALVEAAIGSGALVVGDSAVNTLLAAATLLLVAGPVWWFFWRRIQAAATVAPQQEHASPTRRVFLFLVFGVGGVAAVIALLAGVFLLLEDVFAGTFGAQTLRGMRFAVGVLLTAGVIAAYHWTVYRGEREQRPTRLPGPRFVLLVGPPDPEIAEDVARRTGVRVQAWSRTDGGGAPWSAEAVMAALATTTAEEVMVVSEATGPRAIPIDRG